jgi:squalene synthase HpnC
VGVGTAAPGAGTTVDAASVTAQATQENFPVASRLLPRAARGHLLAIYGFARLADDIGDEAEGNRLAQLDWLESELGRAAVGRATHPLLVRLTPTLGQLDLPLQPFCDLIEANRMDQRVSSYETFSDLLDYCRLSAAPVGRLVLMVFGSATDQRLSWSDDVCNGLQVVEHLQDVGEDAAQGRVYLPAEDLSAAGVGVADLRGSVTPFALRRVVALEANRARRLLEAGGPLAASLALRPRLAVAGFCAGGRAALDAVVEQRYDVLGAHCRPGRRRFAVRLLGALVEGRRAA